MKPEDRHSLYDLNSVLFAKNKSEREDAATVLNLEIIQPVIHVFTHLPADPNLRFFQVYESTTKSTVGRWDYSFENPLWINIPADCLDLSIGLHQYTLEFVNSVTGDSVYQYFEYQIQSDAPDKPYIYMER